MASLNDVLINAFTHYIVNIIFPVMDRNMYAFGLSVNVQLDFWLISEVFIWVICCRNELYVYLFMYCNYNIF